jgi:predicted MFS family arabinose efflux permease
LAVAQPAAHGARAIVLTVLLPFGVGYYFSYLYRTVNAVISPELTREFALSASDLGLLTSAYFLAFAATQIPLGRMLDRYGPRRVQTVLLSVAALGALLFAVGHSFVAVVLGRALIGVGVSACLMASVQANALWWPRERLPLMNALITAFGGFGAISATAPVEALLQVTDWRHIFVAVALATFCVAAMIWFVVPERRAAPGPQASRAEQSAMFRAVMRDGFFWRMTLMFTILHGAFQSYQTLWAAPWLRDVAGLDRIATANVLSLVQIGFFIGAISSGVIADRLRRTGVGTHTLVVGVIVLFFAVQSLIAAGAASAAVVLWFAWGLLGASQLLSFAVFPQRYPHQIIGRVITVVNLLVFVFAFSFQWGVGLIIDLWPPLAEGRFDPAAHRAAVLTLLAIEVAAWLGFVWPTIFRRGR